MFRTSQVATDNSIVGSRVNIKAIQFELHINSWWHVRTVSNKMNFITLFAILAIIIGLSESFQTDSLAENINEDRIVGGRTAHIAQFQYQVSLRERSQLRGSVGWFANRCGGTIIANRWILTAAECAKRDVKDMVAVVGANHIVNDGEIYQLDRIVKHPEYNSKNLHHNLCLLRTAKRIEYRHGVRPIQLRKRRVTAALKATVAGWGQSKVAK